MIALKLEALVGDLEDAVFSVLNYRNQHIFSRTGPTPSIPGVMTDFPLFSVVSCMYTCIDTNDIPLVLR